MTSKHRREIGNWGLIKNEIVEKYAKAYTTILTHTNQAWAKTMYVDVFAGSPENAVKGTGELVAGSAMRALQVVPAFDELYFVDLDDSKIDDLEVMVAEHSGARVIHGDGNDVLRDRILPLLEQDSKRRALILLDPYGMDVSWDVVERLGKCGHAEIILNFPTMDINRNALRRDPGKILESAEEEMTRWWGDDTWRSGFYRQSPQLTLFDEPRREEKTVNNDDVVIAYVERLRGVAGFRYVSRPYPMRNGKKATMYYLVHAGPKEVGKRIFDDIQMKYGG
ncbi:MAG: three-Cys-motif partner protein TcmP [Thermomicrobiales bacterium]